MSWIDNVRGWFRPKQTPPVHARARVPSGRGGRASLDQPDTFGGAAWVMTAPTDFDTNWQLMMLEHRQIELLSPTKLMEMMADLSPEVSRAIWDFLRLCNPGWDYEAFRPGSDVQDKRAMAAIQAYIDTLDDLYGSFDVPVGRMFLGPMLRGAFSAELVLDARGRVPIDFATPDPGGIRFRKRADPLRGEVWQPGQWQGTKFVPLDVPTFRYLPVDPLPASPYGRPLASPALFTSLFLLGMLHDLRRVIQQQGYPRLDIEINTKQLAETSPDLVADQDAFDAYVSNVVAMVSNVYSRLKPDDAYIHTDSVKVNAPVGATSQANLAGIDGVIKALERMTVRALKTMPLMLAIGEGSTEGEANRQWEIYAAGLKSIQHYAESVIERLFTLALQAQGIQATVQFRFAEMRGAEMLRDAQTEAMKIANAKSKYEQGWYSQDEASEEITGHAADVPEPRAAAVASAPELVQGDGDGQEDLSQADAERSTWLRELTAATETVQGAMAMMRMTNGYH